MATPQSQGILYCLIARGSTVLVEQSKAHGNFVDIAKRLLNEISPSTGNRKTFSYQEYYFHYAGDDGIAFICMSDSRFPVRNAYAFLQDVSNRFKGLYGDRAKTAGYMSLNDAFGRQVTERMEHYSNRAGDRLSVMQGEIDTVKNIMVQNIEKMLERGEKLEVLVDKTDLLHTQASTFKGKSTKLKRKMWWQNAKWCICLIITIILVVGIGLFLLLHFLGFIRF